MKLHRLQTLCAACLMLAMTRAGALAQVNGANQANASAGQNGEIALPDGMTDAFSESLLREWNVRHRVTAHDSCYASDLNPEYGKEEYISRLGRLPNVVDMPYNDVVRHFIDQYSGRLRRSVSIMLGASNFYTPIFEDALEAYQLPLELKYLPVIESALNPNATSRAGAAGLWQFTITTGKQYGLEITSLVDERRDPVKSSYAAARYIKDLYSIFGDWTLVIASYNCGPNNVSKAIKRAGDTRDYWQIYTYLPKETQGYVPAFIAADYIMNYYCEHNICPADAELPAGTDTVVVCRDVRLEQISELCGVGMEELKALNPQYRTSLVPGNSRPCPIRLGLDAVDTFVGLGDSVYNHRAGELLSSRELEVEVTETAPKAKSAGQRKGAVYATVRKGDTLGAIARRNGTTVAQIKRLNGLRGNTIRAGQKLRVK